MRTAENTNAGPCIAPPELIEERKFIPPDIYAQILSWIPVSTVDFVPTRANPDSGTEEFCLGFRTQQPFKDTWFVTGGRKNFGETTFQALRRQVLRELGIDVCSEGVRYTFRAVLDVMNPASEPDGTEGCVRPLWYSEWKLHELRLSAGVEPVAQAENLTLRWFTHIHPDFPEPVRQALALLGFSETTEPAGSPA